MTAWVSDAFPREMGTDNKEKKLTNIYELETYYFIQFSIISFLCINI